MTPRQTVLTEPATTTTNPRVKRSFDAEGKSALGDLANHFPASDAQYRGDLRGWFRREPDVQNVLDPALASSILNNQLEVAGFLLTTCDRSASRCRLPPPFHRCPV